MKGNIMKKPTKNRTQKALAVAQAEIDFNRKVLADNGYTNNSPMNLLCDIIGIQRAYKNMPERTVNQS